MKYFRAIGRGRPSFGRGLVYDVARTADDLSGRPGVVLWICGGANSCSSERNRRAMAGNTAALGWEAASDCVEGVEGCGRKSYGVELQHRSVTAADADGGCVAAWKRLSLCRAVAW